jgi:hypothetical protein
MTFTYRLEREDGTPADPPTQERRRPGTLATRSRSDGIAHYACSTYGAATSRTTTRCWWSNPHEAFGRGALGFKGDVAKRHAAD